MDINSQWQNMQFDETGSEHLTSSAGLRRGHSSGTLSQLRSTILMNICWGIVITPCFPLVMYIFPHWQVVAIFSMLTIYCIWAVIDATRLYLSIDPFISVQNDVLSEMKRHYRDIDRWITVQQRIGLLLYPFSIAGGFMIGGMVGSGRTIGEFLSARWTLPLLAVTILILVPLCYKAVKWMLDYAFGKQMEQLRSNIAALEKKD